MLQFLKDMVAAFNVGPNKTHIAVVTYGTSARVEFTFDEFMTERAYYRLIDGMRYPERRYSYTIDKALILADETVFTEGAGMRPELTQVQNLSQSDFHSVR